MWLEMLFGRLRCTLASLWLNCRGSITIVVVGVLFILIGLSSLFIDLGSMYLEKTRLQGAVDRAALKAVTNLSQASDLAQQTVEQNIDASHLKSPVMVQSGSYPPTGYTLDTVSSLPVSDRFEAGATNPNAIRVIAASTAPVFLSKVFFDASGEVSASAVALNEPVTQLMAGTQFADLGASDSSALNASLSSLLGNAVSLTTDNYQGLANQSIDILSFLDQLISQTGGNPGDYKAILNEPVTLAEIIDAAITTIQNDSTLAAVSSDLTSTLNSLRGQVTGLDSITLGDMLSLDASDPESGAGARMDLFGLMFGSAEVLNNHESAVSSASFSVGAATVTISTHVIQTPQYSAVGGVGTEVRNAQSRTYLQVQVPNAITVPILNVTASVNLQIYMTQGAGTATVTDISCSSPDTSTASVGVNATPGLVSMEIGQIDPNDLSGAADPTVSDATIVSATSGLLSVMMTGSARSTINGASRDLTFTSPFTEDNYQVVPLASPTDSMVSDTWASVTPSITAPGLTPIQQSLLTPSLDSLVDAVLTPLAPLIDDAVGVVQGAFGLQTGYMKVADTYLRCSRPMLAQ